ncbi:MAG: primosomal protein [Candidatus Parcubacteria bacterium]|jgi:primosomal protein N'
MYILEVMPLTKSIKKETLSYFSSRDVAVGSLVTIEVRKRIVQGLVVGVRSAAHSKAELKAEQFALKRVRGISKNTLFQAQFLRAAQNIAQYFATSTGSVLYALLPSTLLKEVSKLKAPHEQIKKYTDTAQTERYVMQDQFEERYASYKSLIRESFAKHQSILFICPTSEDVLRTHELLARGIDEHTIVLSTTMTATQLVTAWNKAVTHEKPVLIIATGTFLSIPRHDIGTIIIEKESSSAYRHIQMPYLDIRTCAELYARTIGASFFLADLVLRTETLARYDAHEFVDRGSLKFRSLTTADAQIIDMRKTSASGTTEPFRIFAPAFVETLTEAHEASEHTVLFAARKGLAPSVVCADCGTIVSCAACSAPVVLYGKKATESGNRFRCHVCGDERDAGELCSHCGGWRLQTLGIGVETVASELARTLPEATVFILDGEHAKTAVQARKIIDTFYATPGSILIATEMAISYLREPVEHVLVVTIDALFSLPDYAIRERILRILLRLRSRASKRFFVATRRADDKLFEYARQGNLADFYREEFKDRKQFLYPPFAKLIKLSVAGTPKATEDAMLAAKELLKPHALLVYPAFTERQRGVAVWHGLLKLKPDEWPNDELHRKLTSLPPQFKVLIDAPSLL